VISTVYIYGTGQAPELVFPGNQTITTLGGGFYGPFGVAVDGSGNVYVADYNSGAVEVILPGCASFSCVTAVGGGCPGCLGFNFPQVP
jgi:DNA-binding beta-propeller fold protein YncE